jgi:hypothetical protein
MTEKTEQEKALKWHMDREHRAFLQRLNESGMPSCRCLRGDISSIAMHYSECLICYRERTIAEDYLESHREEFPDEYTVQDLIADIKQMDWEAAYRRHCADEIND